MSVRVGRGATWSADPPTKLPDGPHYFGEASIGGRTYDVSADGQRLLKIKSIGASEPSATDSNIIVVFNWTEELKAHVPSK
jgi:hypothetical protein